MRVRIKISVVLPPSVLAYAVLGATGITSFNTTTIGTGTYGTPGGIGILGSFIGTRDDINAATAQTALGIFRTTTLPPVLASLPTTPFPDKIDNIYTFLPNRNYQTASSFSFDADSIIILDGSSRANPNFYISSTSVGADAITMNGGIEIRLYGDNSASSANVYWLSDGGIKFTGPMLSLIPGNFIARNTIIVDDRLVVRGRLLSQTRTVRFIEISSVNTTPIIGIENPICFPGYTPITTDQGTFPIIELLPGVHTIRGKRIVAVPQGKPRHMTGLVCFEKHSIGFNIPSQRTEMTGEHKILYNDKMIEARKFVGKIIGRLGSIHIVPFDGEVIYNILLDDHSTVLVNNMVCETLDPENIVARLYQVDMGEHMAATASAH